MTTFIADLIYAVMTACIVLVVALVGLACLALAGGMLWLVTGWLADFVASADPLSRAGLAVGVLALLALVFTERERAR